MFDPKLQEYPYTINMSVVKRSHINEYYKQDRFAFRDFHSLHTKAAEKVEKLETFDILGKIDNKMMIDAVSSILKPLENQALPILINNTPQIIKKLKQMINFHFTDNAKMADVLFWPPVVNPVSKQIPAIFYFLLYLLKTTSKPEKLLAWLVCDLFPKKWITSTQKSPLLALSLIKLEKTTGNYAILDDEKVLHIYQPKTKNGVGYKSLYAERTSRAKAAKSLVTVYGPIGNIAQKLNLASEKLSNLWEKVYSTNPPHFFSFLIEVAQPYPSLLYQSIYRQIVHVELIAVQAFAKPGVIRPDYCMQLCKSLLTIGFYSQKFIPIISTMILSVMEEPIVTTEFIASPKCVLHYLAPAMLQCINSPEILVFKEKLTTYIKTKEKFSIFDNPEALGVCFFTSLKYIFDAISILPMAIRMLASMIATFATIRFNSREDVIKIMADFYASIFTEYCLEGNDFNINEIKKLVYLTFMYQKLIPKYSYIGWNERIEKKIVPQIRDVAIELTKPVPCPQFKSPSIKKLDNAIENLIPIIVKNNKRLVDEVVRLSDKDTFRTTCLGWIFASSLLLQFNIAKEDKNTPKAPQILGIAPITMNKNNGPFFSRLALGLDCSQLINEEEENKDATKSPVKVYNGEEEDFENEYSEDFQGYRIGDYSNTAGDDDERIEVSESTSASVNEFPFAETIVVPKTVQFLDYPIHDSDSSDN